MRIQRSPVWALLFFAAGLIGFTAAPAWATSSVPCSDALSAPVYRTGILVRLDSGRHAFASGSLQSSHADLLSEIEKKSEALIAEILWAGELEFAGVYLIAVNETAGLLRNTLLPHSRAGVQTLRSFVPVLSFFKFGEAIRFVQYDPQNEHLHPQGRSFSIVRHDLFNVLNAYFTFLENGEWLIKNGRPEEAWNKWRGLSAYVPKLRELVVELSSLRISVSADVTQLNDRVEIQDRNLLGQEANAILTLETFEKLMRSPGNPEVHFF